MNPSFMAFYKASINLMMGVSPSKRDQRLDQTDSKLFATKPQRDPKTGFPRSDMVVEAEEAEAKELAARAHLTKLAKDVKARI